MPARCSTTGRDGSKNAPFFMKRGLTFSLDLAFKANGRPLNLDSPSRTGRGSLRGNASELPSTPPVVSFTITVTNGPAGLATASVGATATAIIPSGVYVADIEFENDVDVDDVVGTTIFYIEVGDEVTKS